MAFAIETQKAPPKISISIKGSIDEDASFVVQDFSGCTSIIVDMGGITAINSVGIREWIKWIKEFPTTATLTVAKCPKIIVDQINMVSGFLPPGAIVESFFVPYFADDSGEEQMVLFTNGKEFKDGNLTPPQGIKDSTGAEMEMDVIEAKYFKFLKNA
jgi:hypothetical protein